MRGMFEDKEFELYYKNLSKQILKTNGYATRMTLIANYITAYAREETGRCFTETQLKQIFALENKE